MGYNWDIVSTWGEDEWLWYHMLDMRRYIYIYINIS